MVRMGERQARRPMDLRAAVCVVGLLAAGQAAGSPMAVEEPDAVVVTGPGYQLRVDSTGGFFDYLVDPEGDGTFVSVMRPGGERG